MNFNKIIANPPFDKNLHLKILREAMRHVEKEGGELVNLSPIRWLQDPLAEYKRGSDWKVFSDIRARISSLEVISVKDANELFGIKMNDLGIYHITEDGGFDCKTLWSNNSILDKVLAYKDNIYAHMTKGFTSGKWHVKVAEVKGNSTGHNFEIVSRIHMKPYRTVEEYVAKKFIKADAFKNDPNNEKFVAFDTEEEGINFAEYTHTKFFLYINSKWKRDVHVPLKFLPFLPTYKKPWKDADLYEYFDLNTDEIKLIEEEIDNGK